MNETTYLPFVSILIAVLGLVATYFGFVVKVREDIAGLKGTCGGLVKDIDCLPQMQGDLAKLNANNDVFWRVLGPSLGGIIHSPLHKRRDQLMDEWLEAKGNVPEADLRELREELEQMLDEAVAGNSVNLQLAGALLLGRVEGQLAALEQAKFQRGDL